MNEWKLELNEYFFRALLIYIFEVLFLSNKDSWQAFEAALHEGQSLIL